MAEKIGQMLKKAADEMGAEDVRLEQGGKHPRVTGRIGERPFMYVVPGSSSDWRAGRNALCGLRRLLGYERPRPASKDGSGKTRNRKQNKARNRPSCGSANLLPNATTASKPEQEDRFLAPLAAFAAQMQTSTETDDASGSSITTAGDLEKADAPLTRVPLRTPWLGRKQRFQEVWAVSNGAQG